MTPSQAYVEARETIALFGAHLFKREEAPEPTGPVRLHLGAKRGMNCDSLGTALTQHQACLDWHYRSGGMTRDLPSGWGYVSQNGSVVGWIAYNGRFWPLQYLGHYRAETLAAEPASVSALGLG